MLRRHFSQEIGTFLFPTLLLAMFLFGAQPGAHGQSRMSELTGVVTDSQNAVVPKARVVVTNDGTGVQLATESNEAGLYRVQNLIPGSYRIEISSPGFKT